MTLEFALHKIAGHPSISGCVLVYCSRVPDASWTEVVALVAAFLIAVITTPAGISGAVMLLPFQVSVLGTPSPSATPTNLLYNVVSTPGARYRYWRQGQTGGRLALLLIAGSGRKPSEVAPAALAATLVTSAGGVIAFTILSLHQNTSVARPGRPVSPWVLGAWPVAIRAPVFSPGCPSS
jgi:hypothetical protein